MDEQGRQLAASTEDTRSKILKAGELVVLNNSFSSAGISEILKSCDVPKGSFYHYFSSKDDFGVSLIQRCARVYGQSLDEMMFNDAGTARAQLLEFADAHVRFFKSEGCKIHCLIAKLSAEVAAISENMRQAMEVATTGWTAKFSKLVELGRQDGSIPKALDPDTAGLFLFNCWLGAVTQVSILQSPAPFEAFRTTIETLIPAENSHVN